MQGVVLTLMHLVKDPLIIFLSKISSKASISEDNMKLLSDIM